MSIKTSYKLKYVIINGDDLLGYVYESEEFGRTIVIEKELDFNFPVKIWNTETQEVLGETDFKKFIFDILPRKIE